MPVDTFEEIQPIMLAKEQPSFVRTPTIENTIKRALLYLQAGYPVNFSGPAGTGKTTLAMYTAAQLGQPSLLIHGEDEFGSADLVGGEFGYRKKKMVDNFIHSVLKTEEDVVSRWVDNRLTVACKHGFTLIYDEFTRSRPEANNVLLSVLEERVLDLPAARGVDGYLKVHPNFAAIFTSNPVEFSGVYRAQDALLDRMVTLKLDHYDRDTEIAITMAKSNVSRSEAEKIVDLVRGLRDEKKDGFTPTVRAAIMLGKIVDLSSAKVSSADKGFVEYSLDILDSEINTSHKKTNGEIKERILNVIKNIC